MDNKIELSQLDTECSSSYQDLEKKTTHQLLQEMNNEDKKVAEAVGRSHSQIERLVEKIVEKISSGGRVFYIGSGTSGRLGVVDASEILPTFGADNLFIGLIAGGDSAIRRAVEGAEDDILQGWKDLEHYQLTNQDIVIGIAASGRTPYVVAAINACNSQGIETGCIVCSGNSELARIVDYPIEVKGLGAEYLTGSTRLKSGTAQKLVLNQLSTASMIRLGYVKGNKMTSMTPTNRKLQQRAFNMVKEELPQQEDHSIWELVQQGKSVKEIVEYLTSRHEGE